MLKHRTIIALLLALLLLHLNICSVLATEKASLSSIESLLRNGAATPKNIEIMMENAWLNGYDHCKVALSEDENSFVVEIAVRGLSSSLKALAKGENEQNAVALMEVRNVLLTHCRSVIELMDSKGISTSHFSFVLMDDERVLQNEYASGAAIATITVSDGKPVHIESSIKVWNIPISSANFIVPPDGEASGSPVTKLNPTYILNVNSGKFHIPTCDSVAKTKEKNRREFFGLRDELINMGYTPCGSCNP